MNLHLKSELQEYLFHWHSGGKQLSHSRSCQEQFVTTWEELLRILDFLLVSCRVTHLYANAICAACVCLCVNLWQAHWALISFPGNTKQNQGFSDFSWRCLWINCHIFFKRLPKLREDDDCGWRLWFLAAFTHAGDKRSLLCSGKLEINSLHSWTPL